MSISLSRLASFIATGYLREQGRIVKFGTGVLDFLSEPFILPEISHRGEIGEAVVEQILKSYGHQTELQRPVELKIGDDVLRGRIDIYVPDTNTIVEIKTSSDKNELAYYAAVAQATLYAIALGNDSSILIAHVISNKTIEVEKNTVTVKYTIADVKFESPDQQLIAYTISNYQPYYERLKEVIEAISSVIERSGLW